MGEGAERARRAVMSMGALVAALAIMLWTAATAGAAGDATASIVVDWSRTVYYPGADGATGYLVENDDAARMLDAYRRWGEEDLGPPISRRFACDGTVCQAFARGVIAWRGDHAEPWSVLDALHDRGADAALATAHRIPAQVARDERGMAWPDVVAGRLGLLDARPSIKTRYGAVYRDPVTAYGLPTSPVVDQGDRFVVRLQRAVLVEEKGSAAGVQALPVGELARDQGLVPTSALIPDAAPAAPVGEHWIKVSTSGRTAFAMIGTNAVYAAPVTLGKPGFGTPTGTFRIFSRVANETMDSLTIGIPRTAAEGYYLKNVLYTQYFADGGVALHSNYWQPEWVFGQANTSHGCVGLRTADAAYFWSFAGNGTRVVVE